MIFLAEGRDTTFLTPVRVHRKYHISVYLLRKFISHFLPKGKIFCLEKNTVFPDSTKMFRRGLFWKDHLFRRFGENIIFPCIFWERSSFIFRLRCKIIFSGKRTMIFPDNTGKIIFQRHFFGNIIFSGRLKKKTWFSVQWICSTTHA